MTELFGRGPHPHITPFVNFDVNEVGAAADGAILDVFLALAGRRIDRNDN